MPEQVGTPKMIFCEGTGDIVVISDALMMHNSGISHISAGIGINKIKLGRTRNRNQGLRPWMGFLIPILP